MRESLVKNVRDEDIAKIIKSPKTHGNGYKGQSTKIHGIWNN